MSKQTHALGWLIIILIVTSFLIFTLKYFKVEVGDGLVITTKIPRPKILKDLDKKAVLSLAPEQEDIKKIGDIFNVSVYLDTKGKAVDGVDVILNYDPVMLEAQKPALAHSFKGAYPGDILSNLMTNEVDENKGIIKLSALSEPAKTFSGTGILALINFKALKLGETKIAFDFKEDSTEETNVASQGKDILKEVKNLELVIGDQ